MNNYTVDIAGRREALPIVEMPTGARIAFFNLHGNWELTEYCGKKLAQLLMAKNVDMIFTAESKGLQLAHVAARELGVGRYAVARKEHKPYMTEAIKLDVSTITKKESTALFLSGSDSALMKGKRVAIIDDVISTGGTVRGMEELVRMSGGTVAAKACVLAEGESIANKDILRLGELPVL